MAKTFVEQYLSAKELKHYAFIIIGTFIMAAGYVFFINPHGNIVPGGVYGIGIVVNNLTQGMFPNGINGFMAETFAQYGNGIPIGLTGWIINIPLTILGMWVLGPKFGIKTVFGFSICSYFMDLITTWYGTAPLTQDILLSCIFGSIFIGVGLAMVFKARANTAGSDIIAMIINKYTGIPLGQLIIYVDSGIALLSLLCAKGQWEWPLYSFIVIYITGKVIDLVLDGQKLERSVMIISEKHEIIKEYIINELERGGTYINGEGLYQNKTKKVIITVVNRKELMLLEDKINDVDPNAFITITTTTEILGEGFRNLSKKIQENKS
jgi:uncharacterized membrane-anchored protein YitT (DUF2179 family)